MIIHRDTDLTPLTGIPVTVTRPGSTLTGVFTLIGHDISALRCDDAAGMFIPDGHQWARPIAVPYGSTITPTGETR